MQREDGPKRGASPLGPDHGLVCKGTPPLERWRRWTSVVLDPWPNALSGWREVEELRTDPLRAACSMAPDPGTESQRARGSCVTISPIPEPATVTGSERTVRERLRGLRISFEVRDSRRGNGGSTRSGPGSYSSGSRFYSCSPLSVAGSPLLCASGSVSPLAGPCSPWASASIAIAGLSPRYYSAAG